MLNKLKNDKELAEILARNFEVEIKEQNEMPEDEFGHLKYNINGVAFAGDRAGGQYILLEDGSIGFWGSEGKIGRVADNMEEFFTFVINCPFWYNYCQKKYFIDITQLSVRSKEVLEELAKDMNEYGEDLYANQRYAANIMGITLYEDVANDVLMKFYYSTTRSPQFYGEYTEDDGSKHIVDGLLW
ncbi:MAG: hypothetical protein ACRCTE_06735 [Cellulosilyticaceae bacterium]